MNTNLPTPTSNTSSIDHSQQKAPAVKKRRTNVKKEKATNYMTPGSMSVVNSNRGVSLPASAPGVLGVPGNKVPQTQTSSQSHTQQPKGRNTFLPQHQSLQQPAAQSSAQAGISTGQLKHQPFTPNVKSGFIYSHPPSAATPTSMNQSITPYANGQLVIPLSNQGPKPQEDHTLINCFSVMQIETHINSLNKGLQLSPLKLKIKCLEVLKVLQSHQHGWVFNTPVDPVELGLPDYFHVVKQPMDLGSIKKNWKMDGIIPGSQSNSCWRSW